MGLIGTIPYLGMYTSGSYVRLEQLSWISRRTPIGKEPMFNLAWGVYPNKQTRIDSGDRNMQFSFKMTASIDMSSSVSWANQSYDALKSLPGYENLEDDFENVEHIRWINLSSSMAQYEYQNSQSIAEQEFSQSVFDSGSI